MDFEETWAISFEAFVSWDEVGVVAAGVEEGFSSGYTIVDKAQNGSDPKGGMAYLKRNMRHADNNNNNNFSSHSTT